MTRFLAATLGIALVATTLTALAAPAVAQDYFDDISGNQHAAAIVALAQAGVIQGCTADGSKFCPKDGVRRDQSASFLARAMQLRDRTHNFTDVSARSPHSGSIGAIWRAGITSGCDDRRYCPLETMTRAQMATMLRRALDLPDDRSIRFDDVDPGSVHAPGIRAIAAAGITLGCDDAGTLFCPQDTVRRDHMASFLARAWGLEGPVPCPDVDNPEVEPIGPGVPASSAYLTTAAVETESGRLEMLSNDQPTSRSARIDGSSLTATATIPEGSRTWAHTVIDDQVYVGQWGASANAPNLFRFPDADSGGDRTAQAVATVPTGGEFWTLTADEDDNLYAGTRAHVSPGPIGGIEPDEHVVHRIRPDGTIDHLKFTVDEDYRNDPRPDVKQLVWHDGALYVGLGQVDGATRLYEVRGLGTDEEQVKDLTPASLAEARAVFSLDVTDEYIAVGTQASGQDVARLIVLERESGLPLVDAALEGSEGSEARVDQVHIDGDRILAAAVPSGTVYAAEITSQPPPLPPITEAEPIGTPVPDTQTRFLTARDEGIVGVTGTGRIWTLADDGSVTQVNIASLDGAPLGSGRAHSMALTASHILVGGNSNVHVRSLTNPAQLRSIDVAGETKAIATSANGAWAAVYPGGELWRLDIAARDAKRISNWNNQFNRPRNATFVPGNTNRVVVIARSDDLRATALIVVPLGTPGEAEPEAHRIENPSGDMDAHALTADSTYAYVGDNHGYVQAFRLSNPAEPVWSREVSAGRRITSLTLVDGRLTGTAHASDGDSTWFELARDTGALIRSGTGDVGGGNISDGSVLGPVAIHAKRSRLVAVERGADRAVQLARHGAQDVFTRPMVAIDGQCRIYAFDGRDLFRLPYDAATRLR